MSAPSLHRESTDSLIMPIEEVVLTSNDKVSIS